MASMLPKEYYVNQANIKLLLNCKQADDKVDDQSKVVQ